MDAGEWARMAPFNRRAAWSWFQPIRKLTPPMPPKNSSSLQSAGRLTALIMAHGLAVSAHAQSTNNPAPPGNATNAPARLPEVIVKGQQQSPFKPEALSSPKYTEPLR